MGSRRGLAPAWEGAEACKRRPDSVGANDCGIDRDRSLGEYLVDVFLFDREPVGISLVEGVGRAEEEHSLPRDREAHTHLVVGDRQRSRPAVVRVEEHVNTFAEPDRFPRQGVLHPPQAV